jgi:hypothetical protein
MTTELTTSEQWLLSFYRTSEIGGALFFGRLARPLRDPRLQRDMTSHFADESRHAAMWTACIADLGATPRRMSATYQDRYIEAGGMPVNLMEVLAVTHVFERRVAQQYARHARLPGVNGRVRVTLDEILRDERWHIRWVRAALRRSEAEYSPEEVRAAVERYESADRDVFAQTMAEHADVLGELGASLNAEAERGIIP